MIMDNDLWMQPLRIHTCSVVRCLSLNLSSMYRNNMEVFPTHPSPNNTTLKLYVPLATALIFVKQY